MSGLRDKVLREEFVEYVICGLQEELRRRHENLEAGLERLRDEKRRIGVELKRLVDAIAASNISATVMAAINEREARLREITNQVIEPGPESLQEKLEELRTFAVLRLTRMRELLNVCRFVSSGWPRHESEANLSGLDPGTFGRRLALGGCRVARLAGIEDCDECVYGGDQAN